MAIHVRDNRGGNWFWLHNAVIDHYGKQLGPYGIAVYCCLCRHVGQEQYTWVGQKELADEIGGSRAQVHRELTKLRDIGLLHVETRQEPRGQTTNVYILLPVDVPGEGGQSPLSVIGGAITLRGGASPSDMTPSQPESPINKTQLTKPMEQDGGASHLDIIWQAARAELAELIVPTNFERWVVPLRLIELANNHAVLLAPNQIVAAQAQARMSNQLARLLDVERVEFRLADQPEP